MCRFDEARVCIVSEWLIPVLAEMVLKYDGCPKKQTLEFECDEGYECVFTSSCACTTEKRDRRFLFTKDTAVTTETSHPLFVFKKDATRFEFNGETRPVRVACGDESLEVDKGSRIDYKFIGDVVSFSYSYWTPAYNGNTDKAGWLYHSTFETIDLYDVMQVIRDTKP